MIRWVGLGLSLVGGIVAVTAIFRANWEIAGIFIIVLIIGLFALSRPNL